MPLTRTVTNVAAGDDGTATWADQVYADIGSIINYKLVYTQTYGATTTFDMDNSGIQLVTLTGNPTLAVQDEADGQTFVIILKQDGTGSRTVTWWANIIWVNGVVPTLTTTASKYDVFAFIRIGSSYLGFIVGQNL